MADGSKGLRTAGDVALGVGRGLRNLQALKGERRGLELTAQQFESLGIPAGGRVAAIIRKDPRAFAAMARQFGGTRALFEQIQGTAEANLERGQLAQVTAAATGNQPARAPEPEPTPARPTPVAAPPGIPTPISTAGTGVDFDAGMITAIRLGRPDLAAQLARVKDEFGAQEEATLSPLGKLFSDRRMLMQEGIPQDHPIIRAIDREIEAAGDAPKAPKELGFGAVANNIEIEQARRQLDRMNLSREQLNARLGRETQAGFPNPDPFVSKLISTATQRKQGPDPEFPETIEHYLGPTIAPLPSDADELEPNRIYRVPRDMVFQSGLRVSARDLVRWNGQDFEAVR